MKSRYFSRRKRASWNSGYTATEVLLAITLLVIGAGGVIAMQKASVQGNQDARQLDMANAIAREWMERLRRDATLWTPPPTLSSTNPPTNLTTLVTTGVWYTPTARVTIAAPQNDVESPAFDVLGRDQPSITFETNAQTTLFTSGTMFCTNVRLTPLTVDNQLLRAEVRVYWPRNLNATIAATDCANPPPAAIDLATDTYHFVYVVSAIRQNVQP